MKFIFSIVLLISSLFANSQSFEISGSVIDVDTKNGIEGVSVLVVGERYGIVTKKDGSFELKFKSENSIRIKFSHINYEPKYLDLNKDDFTKGKKHLNINLKTSVNVLGAVPITESKPDTVYGTGQYNVGDFAFIGDQKLLLVYKKEKRFKRQEAVEVSLYSGCKLILLDKKNKPLDSISLDDEICLEFDTHYFDEVFLRCENQYYLVATENGDIVLQEYSHKEFDEFFSPIVDSIGDYIYVSTYSSDFPAFEYVVYNKIDSTYRTLHLVVDKPLMDLFRSQYKYLDGRGKLEAFRYELKTGIDKEIIAGYMSGFSSDKYYSSLYAPIFVKNDTLLVFDHYQDKLYSYDKEHSPIDSIMISHHKPKRGNRWKELLLQDESNGNIFSVYEKNGFTYLNQIDCEDGTVSDPIKLYYKFVEKWKIVDDEVYYIFRPFESSQKKFLYKQRLL